MSSWLTPKKSARRLRRRGGGQPSAGRSLKLLAPLPALTGLPPRQRHVGMPIGSNAAPRRPEPRQTRGSPFPAHVSPPSEAFTQNHALCFIAMARSVTGAAETKASHEVMVLVRGIPALSHFGDPAS
jgi:hypothetical protein